MSNRIALFLSAAIFAIFPMLGDEWNKKTVLTFKEPVEVPGVILPAGDYVFKLADSSANRHIVQIFNADEDKIYATILAIPHYRLEPKDKTIILFEERPTDQPPAIHAWFYPGQAFGQEFVYPKSRALELARETHKPVLSGEVKPTETPAELEETPVVEVTPENREVSIPEIAEPAPIPSTERSAEISAPPVKETAVESELPKTASPLPFIGLFGAASLAIAALIRGVRTRNS